MSYENRNNNRDELYNRDNTSSAAHSFSNKPQLQHCMEQRNNKEPEHAPLTKKARAAVQLKFSTNGAIQVELHETKEGIPTLQFEQAKIITVSGKRQGDWSKKIIFQLSPNTELQQLIEFLTNRIQNKSISFKFHGQANNKSMTITKNKDGSVMFYLSQGGDNKSGVVQPTGISQILLLAYKAYADRFNVSVVDAISLLNKSPVAEFPGGNS